MLIDQYPVLRELQLSLVDIVPSEPISLTGQWTSSHRRTYLSDAQEGSGSGPYRDVLDVRWTGTLACAIPIACIAFLITPHSLYWSKSRPPALELPIEISVHAYADHDADRATLAAMVGDAFLPGIPIQHRKDTHDIALQLIGHRTGRLSRLARAEHAELFLYVLPGNLVKIGRKRLWHLRHALRPGLPSELSALLTRGRSGHTTPIAETATGC